MSYLEIQRLILILTVGGSLNLEPWQLEYMIQDKGRSDGMCRIEKGVNAPNSAAEDGINRKKTVLGDWWEQENVG